MKKSAFFLFIIIATVLHAQDSLKITSIANDGFLFNTNHHKIIIDGIFAKGNPNFFYPSDDILLKERNADEPFDSIEIILNTHFHADHINADYVAEHMMNDTISVYIGPQQSYDLMEATAGYDTLKNRLVSVNPAVGIAIDTVINGYNLKVMRFVHHNDNQNQYQVNGYVFTMNGIRIFHPGDGTMNDLSELQAVNLDEDSIDIAFLPYWIVGEDLENAGRQVIDYLNPKIIIIMHVRVGEPDYYNNLLKSLDNLPPVYYLDESLDNIRVLKEEDSLIVSKDNVIVADENYNSSGLKIFLNSTCKTVNIEFSDLFDKNITVEIRSLDGRLKDKRLIYGASASFDISNYVKGIYFFQLYFDNQVITKKISII